MAEPAPALDPSVRAALDKLADIVAPPPASFVPQTWGWAALAAVALVLASWGLLRWRRHREANRYRVEALGELEDIERRLTDGDVAAALAALPQLLKRVALAAWPRMEVASLSQARWMAFLGKTKGGSGIKGEVAAPLAELLRKGEYLSPEQLADMPAEDARACAHAARRWIERHDVSA